MVSGILKSQSSIVRRIAQSHSESISLEKVCERFRRHLSKPNISKQLSENLLIDNCRKIKKDDLIIVIFVKIMPRKWKIYQGYMMQTKKKQV